VFIKAGFCLTRTYVFSGIQFTKHFIEFVFVETNQIVSRNSNVILTRQTCGQRSGMTAGVRHRVLAFYFPVRICYMFLMSKCRGELDLGLCCERLCMTSVLLKENAAAQCRLPILKRVWPQDSSIFKRVWPQDSSALRSSILFASTEVMHRPRSEYPLHFDIRNIQQIRTEK